MRILISKCGIYTSQGKRVLLATRAVVNGRKAVAYVKNGQLQGYEYLDDFNEQCYSGPYMTFEDKKEQDVTDPSNRLTHRRTCEPA